MSGSPAATIHCDTCLCVFCERVSARKKHTNMYKEMSCGAAAAGMGPLISWALHLADKSGLEMHYYLPPRQGPTFGYASLWLMQGGGAHDKSAPTADSF